MPYADILHKQPAGGVTCDTIKGITYEYTNKYSVLRTLLPHGMIFMATDFSGNTITYSGSRHPVPVRFLWASETPTTDSILSQGNLTKPYE